MTRAGNVNSWVRPGFRAEPQAPAQTGMRSLMWSRTGLPLLHLGLLPLHCHLQANLIPLLSLKIVLGFTYCVWFTYCVTSDITFLRCPWPGVMLGKKPLNYFCCPCQPVSTSVNWGSPLLASFLSVISYFPGKTPDWNCLSFVFPSPPCSLPIIVGALSLLVWFHYLSLVNYLPSI